MILRVASLPLKINLMEKEKNGKKLMKESKSQSLRQKKKNKGKSRVE